MRDKKDIQRAISGPLFDEFIEGTKPISNADCEPSKPKYEEGQLVWIPRLHTSAVIGEIQAMEDFSGDILDGCFNYRCVTIKGIQWISEEYIEPFETWNAES